MSQRGRALLPVLLQKWVFTPCQLTRHCAMLCRTRMLTNHVRAGTLLSRTPLRPSEGSLSPGAALASRLGRPLISLSVWGRLQEPSQASGASGQASLAHPACMGSSRRAQVPCLAGWRCGRCVAWFDPQRTQRACHEWAALRRACPQNKLLCVI